MAPERRQGLEPGREGERRQLTVLFCDIVGSTPLSERLDPEDLREVIHQYQDACTTVVSQAGGFVSQYLGDGVLAYFGYPHAHEDDARRAVRAALVLLQRISSQRTETRMGVVSLSIRIGIHTGVVVVGEGGSPIHHEPVALGKTPNVAARLQDLARPDSALISVDTWRLVRAFFECRDLGALPIRGVSSPLRVYEVVSERLVHSRLSALDPSEIAPLVGREEELALLEDRWKQAREGRGGRTVLLSGEAGIGKSRLLVGLKSRISGERDAVWECWCSPDHQDSALYPIIELFRRIFDLDREPSTLGKVGLIRRVLSDHDLLSTEALSIWSSLMALDGTSAESSRAPSPYHWKQQVFGAVLDVSLTLSKERPVLLIIEDLQWADPSTLELLERLVTHLPTERMLIVLVCRSEFQPSLMGHPQVTRLTLNRFSRRHSELLIGHVTNGEPLPAEVMQEVVLKTDGVPLFLEELTKMVLESGIVEKREGRYAIALPLGPLGIPSTLQDSLMARLDRLGEARDVAQLCAVIGRSFPYDLLRAAADIEDHPLQQRLARVVEAGLLLQEGDPPAATYVFKHALIRDAAYQSLLQTRRRGYHRAIARALADKLPEAAATQPELVAYHYAEAGLVEEAVRHYHLAGDRTIARSANLEAVVHLRRALDLLAVVPPGTRRDEIELALQASLGVALVAAQGYAALDVERAYRRARELCQTLGTAPQLAPVLRGLTAFHYVRAELAEARALGEQCLELAYRHDDVALRVGAHLELGSTLFSMGAFRSAHEHLSRGIALYDPAAASHLTYLYGQDLGVSCLARAGITLACMGEVHEALRRSCEALARAEALSHPLTTAYALAFAAVVRRLRGESGVTLALAERTIHLSAKWTLPFWLCLGTLLKGWALADRGEIEAGIACLEEALASWEALGAQISTPYFLGELAEGYRKAGRAKEGLAVVTRALALGERTGDRWYEAALHRIKGDLLTGGSALARGDAPPGQEVEESFRDALAIARRQDARTFELAAGISLGEQLLAQGRREDAHELIRQSLNRMPGSHGTAEASRAMSLMARIDATS